MFQPGGPPPNAQMFVGGPKGSPMGGMGMGGPPPDAGQPLPPSMSQNNSFKSSPFVGPTTADPNYAQQFHNFQQQLYATGTRNPMGGPPMGPGPPPGHPQQAYFNPKQGRGQPYTTPSCLSVDYVNTIAHLSFTFIPFIC